MTPVCEPVPSASSLSRKFPVRAQIVLASCACAGATAFLYAVDPVRHSVYPQCLLYNATGIYCAGCGATRALHALLHGRVLQALHDNVLFVSALPLLFYVALMYAITAWQNHSWPKWEPEPWKLARWGVSAVLVMLGFMIARNLPGWPFSLLRPLS